MKTGWTVFLSLITLVTSGVSAGAEEGFWSGDVEVGAVFTSGNTDQRSVKIKAAATRTGEVYVNKVHADTFKASENGNDTADKFYAFYRLDRKLDDHQSVFARLAYEDDNFSGFDREIDLTLGYSRLLVSTDNLELTGDVGVGSKYSRLETGGSETEALLRLAGDLKWQFSETARFVQELDFEIGQDRTITRSTSALETTIVGDLAMKIGVHVKHNSDVPVGKDKTDTESTITLVYKY